MEGERERGGGWGARTLNRLFRWGARTANKDQGRK
jgi:hypothetical protein